MPHPAVDHMLVDYLLFDVNQQNRTEPPKVGLISVPIIIPTDLKHQHTMCLMILGILLLQQKHNNKNNFY